MCFVQSLLTTVYSQAKSYNGLRSGDNAGELLCEKTGELSFNHIWVRFTLWDGAESYRKQKFFRMFELIILQNMLDVIILVDFDTSFYEK
jgi:hypothetical protein